MGEGLGKIFHSPELWVILFFLANLMLMSSQDVCYVKGSEQNSTAMRYFLSILSS